MTDLKEKKRSSETIFQGRLLDVRRDEVILPNGNTSTREWINHPGVVCCVPILPDGRIGLIRKLNIGEEPENCAVRELEEEIGYKSKKLTFLTHIHPAIGFANEKMWLYLVEELVKTETNLDTDEFLELIPTALDDAVEMVWNGKITDVKTIIGLLWVDRHYRDSLF